jgi:hypothetical protein
VDREQGAALSLLVSNLPFIGLVNCLLCRVWGLDLCVVVPALAQA